MTKAKSDLVDQIITTTDRLKILERKIIKLDSQASKLYNRIQKIRDLVNRGNSHGKAKK